MSINPEHAGGASGGAGAGRHDLLEAELAEVRGKMAKIMKEMLP